MRTIQVSVWRTNEAGHLTLYSNQYFISPSARTWYSDGNEKRVKCAPTLHRSSFSQKFVSIRILYFVRGTLRGGVPTRATRPRHHSRVAPRQLPSRHAAVTGRAKTSRVRAHARRVYGGGQGPSGCAVAPAHVGRRLVRSGTAAGCCPPPPPPFTIQ